MKLNSFIIAKKLSVIFILLIITCSVFLPNAIRDVTVFIFFIAIAFTLAVLRIKNGIPKNKTLILLFLFCILCFIYILLSLTIGNWTEGYLYDSSYIFRHSYFSLLLPVIVLASMLVFKVRSNHINTFISNKAVGILFTILLIDILSACFFGSQTFYLNNGYTFYLEKGFLWIIVCYVYFYSMAKKITPHLIFSIVTTAFFAERIIGYGTVFSASTGALIYLIMLASYISWGVLTLNRLFYLCLKWILISALIFVFIAPFFSDSFLYDLNTHWRLEAWRNNLASVIENNTFGSGFGVSYFPLTQDTIDWAFHAYSLDGSKLYFAEHMFIRGQHSSIINIVFRSGLLGGAIFLSFLISAFINYSQKDNNFEYKYLVPIFTCAILNISVHVGLESPPNLITFSIAAGFLIEATQIKTKKTYSKGFNK